MKKTTFLLLMAVLLLAAASCKRAEVADPEWDSPAGLYIQVNGSASPAVLFIDGKENPSTITVRVTRSNGTPVANATLFFEQLNDLFGEVAWGRFENGAATIKKTTNASGEARVVFYSPTFFWSHNMYIHVLMQIDGDAYHYYSFTTIPQDHIALGLVYAFSEGAAPPQQ